MSSPGLNNDKEQIACPSCGIIYPTTAKFCGQDGTVLIANAPAASEVGQMHCSSCKNNFPAYAQFCPYDSQKLVPYKNSNELSASFSNDEKEAEDSFQSFQPEIIGKTIASKYQVESLLGEGGMAQVFKARHLGLDRSVVIKLMHSSLPSMDTALKRFEQECKVTAKIDHPNVVTVFDVGTLEGRRPYLVMEYIQGESLRDYLEREVSMDVKNAARLMIQICSGLYEAHTQGIVHRDLKPENIMLRDRTDRPDWAKIVDFGIAHLKRGGQRLTKTGIAIGTVDYMSPEYLSDKPIDHRADIYSLGIIFFELVTGRCPFAAETAEAVMAKHLWSKPISLSHYRPDLSPNCIFNQITEKCLEKEADKRYQSVEEMKSDFWKALKEFESK